MNNAITAALARKRNSLGKKEKGFTLIELLVVVLIIGVLAAVAIPIFLNQQDGAKNSAVAAQITSAKTAVVAQYTSTGVFPTSLTTLDGFTQSADITVTISATPTAASFTITGVWADDTTAADHRWTINQSGAAIET